MLKYRKTLILLCIIAIITFRYICNINTVYYAPKYEFKSIKSEISAEISENIDFSYVSKYTGLSPYSAKEFWSNGETDKLLVLNELYFKTPKYEKDYIAFPITAQERTTDNITPMANLKDGDILITYNTHTLHWRHGHAAIVVDAENGIILEHMAIGQTSVLSSAAKWSQYPGFIILRHPNEKIAKNAADYAANNLEDIPYSIVAGVINKDKSEMNPPDSSHCSHIVWQAYKAAGVDIDSNRGAIVTPEDIAKSDELKVVQIFGINPDGYSDRFLY